MARPEQSRRLRRRRPPRRLKINQRLNLLLLEVPILPCKHQSPANPWSQYMNKLSPFPNQTTHLQKQPAMKKTMSHNCLILKLRMINPL